MRCIMLPGGVRRGVTLATRHRSTYLKRNYMCVEKCN
jgi:hypothetical protein